MNLLITGAFAWTEEEISVLRELGHNVVFLQQEKQALPCDPKWVEGVICNALFLYHKIEEFTSLRLIQLTSVGYDRVPMEYITSRGISIYNAGTTYAIPMAEFALSGVLQLYKRSAFFLSNQKKREWVKHRKLLELFGKKVCIVGCGNVGVECAKRFSAFGCNVIGADIRSIEKQEFDRIVPISELDQTLKISDIIVLTLPLTEQTSHLINEERLSLLKRGAILVNISRGGIIDTNALIHYLKEILGGAVLDVFEEEPLPANSQLWDMENVILTPHNSFVGEGNHERLFNLIKTRLGE